ncbi:hypothetical protein [Rhodopirellula europaea]|uniref:hypothetical protein n=1 Tax=Rhodopirellula europaea TaxID=1263866 RepID=UPI003D2C2805
MTNATNALHDKITVNPIEPDGETQTVAEDAQFDLADHAVDVWAAVLIDVHTKNQQQAENDARSTDAGTVNNHGQ